jgi:hypothetical protein
VLRIYDVGRQGKSMPRYYFSLDDGKFLDDVDGTHLCDPVTAVLHAKQLARNLAKRPGGDRNWLWLRSVVVVDERGQVVCTVPLRSVSAE